MKLLFVFICAILKLSALIHANDASVQSYVFSHTKQVAKSAEPILTKSTEVAALGRVADLGDLYDARSDNFVEISLYTTDLSGDAIHSTDNAYSSIDYIRTESLFEKMEKLGVQASLSVSFLGGLVSVSGSGKYLNEDKKSAKSAKTSLIYSVRTVRDDLKIFSKSSRDLFDPFLLENIDATHVVVGIDWGANVVLSLEETHTDSSNFKEIQGRLEAALDLAVLSVSGAAEVNFGSSDVESSSTFSLHLNGDIIPNTVPQTINESIAFIRDVPNLIKNENGGKGKILNYILMPLPTVQKVFQAESNRTGIVKEIGLELIDQFMRIFQEMKDSELQINDAYDSFSSWSLMVPENESEEISEMKSKFDSFTNDLRIKFSDLVVQFRSGKLDDEALLELISSYESSNYTAASIDSFLEIYTPTMHKIELLNLLQSFNALFIDKRTDKYKIVTDNYRQEIRIMSVDLSIDVSSPYVHDIIRLLEIESGKDEGAISYYIEDVDVSVPEVKAYLEGTVVDVFAVDKKEYVLLTDDDGKVIILDINSYEEVHSYVLPELTDSPIAVVNNVFYNFDLGKGIILSTGMQNIMAGQSSINWTQVGSFPPGEGWQRSNTVVNGSLIYFFSSLVLYTFDTTVKTVIKNAAIPHSYDVVYSVLVNDVLYMQVQYSLYSFDGTNINEITTPESRKYPELFQLDNLVCRVGGNQTDVYPDPVSCYDPSAKTWIVNSYINEARYYLGIVAAGSKTYIFGGETWHGTTNSVEMFDPKTKIWSYVPSTLSIEQSHLQAVSFYF